MNHFSTIILDLYGVSELGFNVPPTTRSYGDGTSVKSLIQKTGETGDRSPIPELLVYDLYGNGLYYQNFRY